VPGWLLWSPPCGAVAPLPSFPENFTIKLKNGGKYTVSYPCVMLNVDVHDRFTNHQYQDLQQSDAERAKTNQPRRYTMRSENSIFFEVDGPCVCCCLPDARRAGRG
jgi:DNA polymerase epsilon subunit 1